MEDIKVGEYVRLEGGYIRQYIKRSLDNHIILDKAVQGFNYLTSVEEKEKIIKHSSNLIDLIEVGDIVNGKLIHKIDKGPNYCYLYYGNCKTFVDYQIQTILTKEQFEVNCYKVGGEDE